jgi:hypothetical protein
VQSLASNRERGGGLIGKAPVGANPGSWVALSQRQPARHVAVLDALFHQPKKPSSGRRSPRMRALAVERPVGAGSGADGQAVGLVGRVPWNKTDPVNESRGLVDEIQERSFQRLAP